MTGEQKPRSYPIRVDLVAAAAQPAIIVTPSEKRQRVLITCAFGLAVVTVALHSNEAPWLLLPAANTWDWTLEPGEGLFAVTTVNTLLTGIRKDVEIP